MTIRQIRIVLVPLVILVLNLSFGCAQQMKSLQPEQVAEVSATAQIQNVTVADDASRIEVISDRPIVYTYYMLESPPRVIVDIAQTVPGKQPFPVVVNKSGIAQIDITKHEFGSGVLSRIDILLTSKAEITASLDKSDKKKLTIYIPVETTEKQDTLKATVAASVAVPETVTPTVGATAAPAPVENMQSVQPISTAGVDSSQAAAEPAKAEPATGAASLIPPAEPIPQAEVTTAAAKHGGRVLSAIKVVSDGIQLETSAEPESFKAFKLSGPDRLVVDIPKTKSALASTIVDVNAFSFGKARIGSTQDKLRIVFDATGNIPQYTVSKNPAGLLLAFGEKAKAESAASAPQQPLVESTPAPVTAPAAPKPSVAPVASPAPSLPAKPESRKDLPGVVEAVEFTQADGISRITIKTSGSCTAGDPVKNKKGYTLALKGCRLPVKLQRQLDTSGFESAIKSIAPFSVSGRSVPETRLAVNLNGSLPNSLHKGADLIEWDFKEPVKPAKAVKRGKAPAESVTAAPTAAVESEISETKIDQPQSKSDKAMEEAFALDKVSQPVLHQGKKYTGRKVTLEFSDADIKKIFQLLAEVSNQNILVSDDVTGTISLKLVNVPWDQALDVILENKGLGMQKEGNIVQIRPKTKMRSLDDEAVEMRLTEEKKMPLSTVIFDINFATLSEIESQFKHLKSKRTDSSISTDARTNKIIVVDIDPNISKMRKLLEQLDVPEKQVMIEARIVEASSSFARDIGVKWGFGYSDGSASNGNISGIVGTMGGVVSGVLPTATTGGIATGVTFGKLLSNFQLDMRLSAAASIGQIKIVSTPKVMTVNNKAAKISQGQMIPYQNTSSTDGAKTEFIEAALSLEVTPHITADGNVTMKIKASNNTAGVGNPPPINKKEATTELVVKNGETTVIGGIYVDSDTEGETGVPYLQDIPLLGNLFKSNSSNKIKNEMLIFITPRIMN